MFDIRELLEIREALRYSINREKKDVEDAEKSGIDMLNLRESIAEKEKVLNKVIELLK